MRTALISDERGATMLIVAISLTALIGVTALAVETGRLWNERRLMVTATDAAATAAAGVYADGGDGCAEAQRYVLLNAPDTDRFGCDSSMSWHGRSGAVAVRGRTTIDYGFGRFLGLDSGIAESSTAVVWGRQIYSGIRPFAFCSRANPELEDWLANPVDELEITYYIDQETTVGQCSVGGQSAGNWGLIDFDGGANDQGSTVDWLRNGFNGEFFTSTSTARCDVEPLGCYDGDPGVLSNALDDAFESLTLGDPVPMVFYDAAYGNGANMKFRISGITPAQVVDYKLNGRQADRYVTVRFQPGYVTDNWMSEASRVCGEVIDAECLQVEP